MARDDAYAESELREESWHDRMTRVNKETRDLIAASCKVIDQSWAILATANETLERCG